MPAHHDAPQASASPCDETRRRYPWWHPHAWSDRLKIVGLLAIAFAVWGWVDVRLRGTVDPENPGIHKTDLTVYTEAGAAFFDGRKPYEVTNPRGWGYLYPPPFAMLLAPLHALPPRAQVLVWFALSVAMLYGCYAESVRVARIVVPDGPQNCIFGPIPLWIGWTALVAATLPALNCLQRGQVGVAKLYLLLLGLRLCLESRTVARSFAAGCVLALPVVVKLSPIVPVGMLVFAQVVATWRAADRSAVLRRTTALGGGVVFATVLTLILLPAGAVGWRANLQNLNTWWHAVALQIADSRDDSLAGDSSSVRNQSLTNAVERLGNWGHYFFADGPNDENPMPLRMQGQEFFMDSPTVKVSLVAVRAAAACLLLVLAYRVGRSRDTLAVAAMFGLACVSTLVLSPISRGHYYVLLMPAALFAAAWFARKGRIRWAVATVGVPAVLSVTHYVLLDVAGRVGLLGIGTSLWYAATCVALAAGVTSGAALAAPTSDDQSDDSIGRRPMAA
mgnify:CR=1 FL=1